MLQTDCCELFLMKINKQTGTEHFLWEPSIIIVEWFLTRQPITSVPTVNQCSVQFKDARQSRQAFVTVNQFIVHFKDARQSRQAFLTVNQCCVQFKDSRQIIRCED